MTEQITTLKDYTEYRTIYFKGFDVYAQTVLATVPSIFGIWMIVMFKNIWITLIFILPALFLPLFIVAILKNKVRFGGDYVESISMFGKKRIYIKDINRFGVYFQGKYSLPFDLSLQKIEDIDDDGIIGYVIYLSTSDEFDLKSFRPKRHVRFPYRKNLYAEVRKIIRTPPSPQHKL